MKKIKLLSLFLALLMLCGTVTLFASCGGEQDGILELSKDTLEVDVTEYAIVYGDTQGEKNYTTTFRGQVDAFAQKLTEVTGKKFSASKMGSARTEAGDKEILIGLTKREESEKALKEIDGTGFIVQVTENKIVIVGTDNLFTLMGLTYFTEKYLNVTEQTKVLTLHETMIANEVGTIVLTSSADKSKDMMSQSYSYVYQDGLGKTPGTYTTVSDNKFYKDYPQLVIDQLVDKISKLSGVQKKLYDGMVRSDKETTDKEVLVGLTAREESQKALAGLAMNQFIISSTDKKVVINAWSQATLSVATKAYLDIMEEGTKTVDDQTIVEIPCNFRVIGYSTHEWVTDFTKPEGEGISLYNTQSSNNGGLQYLYTGTGVNRAAYDAYCLKLKKEGYKVYTENEVEGSVFTTFVHKGNDACLYVAFNAYTHKDEYDSYDWTIIKKIDEKALGEGAAYDYDPCIRIISSTIENAKLPEEKLLKKQSYTYVTDTKITTVPIYGKAVGLCYIITLEDGRFIVFDGGGIADNGGVEHETIWNALNALYKDANGGAAPTTSKPIELAAWVLTHAHWDHYTAFTNLAKKYGQSGLLKVDYMIANTPGADSCFLWNETPNAMSAEKVKSLQNYIKGGFTYIQPRTGHKFYLANIEIEVLTTWEDLNPITPDNDNNTNTVLRFTVSSKGTSKTVTQIWTGDANRWQSRFMCATYGNYLKSDMVSIAHHGNAGCEIEFYDKVSPTTVWWPHNANAAQDYIGSDKNKGYMYEVDQHVYNDIASVKYVYTSGMKKSEGGATTLDDGYYTTLVINKDGVDYDNIYDVVRKWSDKNEEYKLQYFHYIKGSIGACTKK